MNKRFIYLGIVLILVLVGTVIALMIQSRTLSTIEAEIDDVKKEIEETTNEITELEAENSEFLDSIDETNLKLSDIENEYNLLHSLMYCEESLGEFEIDYESNTSLADSLTNWLLDRHQVEEITDNDWNEIWTNSKTAIHSIEVNKIQYRFLAFFDQPELGDSTAVFNIGGMCWLDHENQLLGKK